MDHKAKSFLPFFLFFLSLIGTIVFFFPQTTSHAQTTEQQEKPCSSIQRNCLIDEIITLAANIEKTSWRDQTYRETAKTLAFDGIFDKAVSLIEKIETPDTRAMTIRGIGMMLAAHNYPIEELNKKFSILRIKAENIQHPPSHGIALTYIAMAQAFAKDDEGAWKTCAEMKNIALRNKAYGETAEIQAERGDFNAANTSIKNIKTTSYRNKAYETTSRILSDKGLYEDALKAATAITNSYKRTQTIQYMLDKQKPRERLQSNAGKK
ncbi:MAG: hypothetical protein KAJ40_00230 [Alphaproteobacteria bacterium]|nr:hypothetical protein [Alphaproteobacteria bacterium]